MTCLIEFPFPPIELGDNLLRDLYNYLSAAFYICLNGGALLFKELNEN